MFETLNGKGNRFWTTAAGAVVVSFWVAVLAAIPLIYYQDIPMSYVRSLIIAPPLSRPPAPVRMAGVQRMRPVAVQFNPDRIYEPFSTRQTVAAPQVENPLTTIGVPGGIPVGVPGGITDVLPQFGVSGVEAPPPFQEKTPMVAEEPIRVWIGGDVQAAKLIFQPRTSYPPLARQARVQGIVRLEAIINMDGTIENLMVLSGHPLLVRAALDSVRQWRYQPTLLNGAPVEVVTIIEVNFTLAQP